MGFLPRSTKSNVRRGSASALEFSTAYCARRRRSLGEGGHSAEGSLGRRSLFNQARNNLAPPEFVLFVNDPQLMTEAYRRYLEARIREAEPYPGLPIILTLRARARER